MDLKVTNTKCEILTHRGNLRAAQEGRNFTQSHSKSSGVTKYKKQEDCNVS